MNLPPIASVEEIRTPGTAAIQVCVLDMVLQLHTRLASLSRQRQVKTAQTILCYQDVPKLKLMLSNERSHSVTL